MDVSGCREPAVRRCRLSRRYRAGLIVFGLVNALGALAAGALGLVVVCAGMLGRDQNGGGDEPESTAGRPSKGAPMGRSTSSARPARVVCRILPAWLGILSISILAGALVCCDTEVDVGDHGAQDGRDQERRAAGARADIHAFETALKQYRLHHGRYPTTSQGLVVLTEPTDRRPEGYLERFDENDPWGNPYDYTSDGRVFLIVTYGADGIEGGEGLDADIRSDRVD
jgi:general secretion pathway protein G